MKEDRERGKGKRGRGNGEWMTGKNGTRSPRHRPTKRRCSHFATFPIVHDRPPVGLDPDAAVAFHTAPEAPLC